VGNRSRLPSPSGWWGWRRSSKRCLDTAAFSRHPERHPPSPSGLQPKLPRGFLSRGWETQPVLIEQLKLIGDFRKDLVFVEIQFGNSSALYRDYYKFQYGLAQSLLSLAVLIVPETPTAFFPTRPASVRNMAEARLARKCLTTLLICVPNLV
jgi:hypothetical protein